ncbi:MAG: T9SS type A sorting domain-containing protein [Crocinitomicaceae bacterium]
MKTFIKFLALFVVLFGTSTAFAQLPTPLYAGFRSGNQLHEIDTSGGSWTVASTMTLTTDLGGTVNGVKGIAMDPTDEQIYVLYGWNSQNGLNRRLGELDPMTGSITDVGSTAQGLNDIDFDSDGQMYVNGGYGWGPGLSFAEMDKTTGASTTVLIPTGTNWGSSSLAYEPFDDDFMYLGSGTNNYSRIDQDAGTFAYGTVSGWSGEAHGLVAIDDNTAWFNSYSSLYSLNTSTGVATFAGGLPGQYHSMAFGPTPCEEITVDVTSYAFCEGEEVTLTGTSATGGTITWSDGVENGVAFDPGPDGTYEYYIFSDSEDDCPIEEPFVIEVIGLPTVIASAGDLNFCIDESITLSAGGDAHLYEWNDGAELDLLPGVAGEYTFSLTGYYTEGGCLGENDDEVTVTVHELPTITATASDDVICIGLDVTLNGGGGATYEWDMGVEDGVAFSPNTIGTTTYTVIGTDENGCMGEATIDITVTEEITITYVVTPETVFEDGEIDITVTGGVAPYTFDWDNDGTGDFDDTEDLTGLADALYTVVVNGSTGCSATEKIIVSTQASVGELSQKSISIYPNPTVDMITIEFEGTFVYELMDINGAIITQSTATDKEEVSLENVASGVYFVNVTSGENTSTVKLVKK